MILNALFFGQMSQHSALLACSLTQISRIWWKSYCQNEIKISWWCIISWIKCDFLLKNDRDSDNMKYFYICHNNTCQPSYDSPISQRRSVRSMSANLFVRSQGGFAHGVWVPKFRFTFYKTYTNIIYHMITAKQLLDFLAVKYSANHQVRESALSSQTHLRKFSVFLSVYVPPEAIHQQNYYHNYRLQIWDLCVCRILCPTIPHVF